MLPAFEEPQWKLVSDSVERSYGYAKNRLTVQPLRGAPWVRLIQVPTDFFTFADSVLSSRDIGLAQKHGAEFFLDQGQDGDWYFGFVVLAPDDEQLFRYLWRYTPAKLPGWLMAKL